MGGFTSANPPSFSGREDLKVFLATAEEGVEEEEQLLCEGQ